MIVEPIAYRVRWAKRRLLKRLLQPTRVPGDLLRLGVSGYGETIGDPGYGSWWVPESALVPGAVAYCAGAGEDITFDLDLLERGLTVVVFDPTPKAVAHIERLRIDNPRFRFFPVGWWDRPDEIRFYAPDAPWGVSHSALKLHGTTGYFVAPVDTPASFAKQLGHDHVSIVKIDIEGAETRVLKHMMRHGPRPDVLCVEFDDNRYRRVLREVVRLRLFGYRPAHSEPHGVTFIRR